MPDRDFRKVNLSFRRTYACNGGWKKMCNDNSLHRQWKRETKKILSLNKIYTWKKRLWIGQGEGEVFCLSTGIGRLKDTIARRPLPKRSPFPSHFHYCIRMLSSSNLGAKTEVKSFTLLKWTQLRLRSEEPCCTHTSTDLHVRLSLSVFQKLVSCLKHRRLAMYFNYEIEYIKYLI